MKQPILKSRFLALLLCFTALLSGWCLPTVACAQATGTVPVPGETNVTSAGSDVPSTPEPLLAAGDEVSIRLFGVSDYTFTGRIAVDGTVLLPLIGITHLSGLSVTQAEQFIARQLEQAGQYRNPQVILTLAEGVNATVTFSGEMHGVVPVVGSRSLYAALSVAGGLPPSASRTVEILRPGHAEPIKVDLGSDPAHLNAGMVPLYPGDTILVSRLGVVYVSGEFHTPGTVPLTNYGALTLSQLSALVGGPVYDAKYNELHIIRTVGDHRTVSTYDLKKVLYGKAPDPIMQPNDIVFLPPSTLKQSLANGTLSSVLGVLSFALATVYTLR